MVLPLRAVSLFLVLSLVIEMAAGAGEIAGRGDLEASPPVQAQLVCAADPFVVYPGQQVGLKAWIDLPPDGASAYAWSVEDGRLIVKGDEASWDLTGAKFGPHRATVSMVSVEGRRSECEMRVILSLPALSLMGADRETGRGLLLPGRVESKGCPRRSKSEPPCRSNIEPGLVADQRVVSCG